MHDFFLFVLCTFASVGCRFSWVEFSRGTVVSVLRVRVLWAEAGDAPVSHRCNEGGSLTVCLQEEVPDCGRVSQELLLARFTHLDSEIPVV